MKESFEASVVHRSSCGITGVAGLHLLLRQKLEKQKMPARKHDAHPERQLQVSWAGATGDTWGQDFRWRRCLFSSGCFTSRDMDSWRMVNSVCSILAALNDIFIFHPPAQSRMLKRCTKQSVTATASHRSQKCWGRRPHFSFGGILTIAEIERRVLYRFASD